MNLDRRFLLKLLSTLSLVACKEHSAPNAQYRKTTPVEMPPEEFKLLEEAKTRTSTDKPLVIQSRLLGTPHRLDGGELANVEFVDCDFLGHFMFNVNQEVHVDTLHRMRIRYEFQDADDASAPASTWVRVQQPLAGSGTGMSFQLSKTDPDQFGYSGPPQ